VTLAPARNEGLAEQLERYRGLVAPRMLSSFEGLEPARYLYGLIEKHIHAGGKGLRPALCLATTAAFGGDVRVAIPYAASLEMLHNAFLVHDDIEDGSESRRGRPTMYAEQGLALAVNAGDAMQALSVRLLRDELALLGPDLGRRVFDEFDHLLMQSLEGQALELGWIRDNNCGFTEDDYLRLVLKKTCWYSFIHPCRIGALLAGVPTCDLSRFNRFGFLLGAAFQIQDDVLNLVGDEVRYGKEIGGDLWEGKRTLILAHLFRRVSGPERERLANVLGKPRARRLPREIAWLYELIARHESIAFARQAARELAAAAQQEFELAFADAGEGIDRDFIRSLVGYTIARDL
jgi:geranylgeranyl diphosphate synthase, type II